MNSALDVKDSANFCTTLSGVFLRVLLNAVDAFNGDARMQQGLTSDSIDVGIGSGPGMAFMVKGVPAKAVFAMAPKGGVDYAASLADANARFKDILTELGVGLPAGVTL